MRSAPDLLTRWPGLDVAGKRARLLKSFHVSSASIAGGLNTAARQAADGLFRRDPAVWSGDPDVQAKIANRLGWLDSPMLMADSLDRLKTFAESIRLAGFTDVVLLGMGGSSLAPEVLRAVVGVAPGFPRLHVLDSTDPAAVRAASTTPATTLYLLASKSGTTIEPNVLAAHFRRTLEDARVPRWADHFVAITDEGTELARRARTDLYRDVFINPSDIGGRFSALSFFGLVPAALMGQDVPALVGWGLGMLAACQTAPAGDAVDGDAVDTDAPGTALGLCIGAAAGAGRDKLTLLLPADLEPFGLWVEQLVAESTGKQGTGVVPIAGEPPAEPSAYGSDRLFVRLKRPGHDEAGASDAETERFRLSGAPVLDIELPESTALGAEFLRWEVATAVAGALLRINPFDEPNVKQAKDATRTLLDQYNADGRLPHPVPDSAQTDGSTFSLSAAARRDLAGRGPEALLTLVHPGDYVALLAYLGPDAEVLDALKTFRVAVRDRTRAATMFGYGPRYLHSAGQLHKGGPNTGIFILISATPREDVPIPGERFSFGTLELAQAIGDFKSLDATGRRALHVHLAAPDAKIVGRIADSFLGHLL